MDRTTVSYDVALHLLSADGHVLPLTAILQYDARDPLAVTALFNDGSGAPIRWVFARDLLEAGLDQSAGEGDVLIWPTRDVDGLPAIHIRLRSPHGDALLEAWADELERFLLATHRLVPPGSEQRHPSTSKGPSLPCWPIPDRSARLSGRPWRVTVRHTRPRIHARRRLP